MFLRSKRLFLRPAWPEDENEVRTLADGPASSRALSSATGHEQRLLLTVPGSAGSHIIGWLGLRENGRDCELGLWIADGWRGRGYAIEAVRAVLPLARALGHRRIVAAGDATQPRLVRLFEKAGFRRDEATGRHVLLLCVEADDDNDPGADRRMAA